MSEKKQNRSTQNKVLIGICIVFGICLLSFLAFGTAILAKETINNIKTGRPLFREVTSNVPEKVELKQVTLTNEIIDGQISDLSPIVEKAMPSIVSITNMTTATYYNFWGAFNEEVEGSGSGIIFEQTKDSLLIMTNNHVVEKSKELQVTFVNDQTVPATIRGTDEKSDLAVIEVKLDKLEKDTLDAIQIATLGDSDKVKVGQMALAIGNALGYGQSLTVGYISAKDREVKVDGRQMVLLQTDAAINPGNSGGALLNMDGEVIGINSVKLTDSAVEGMGYAIPVNTAIPIIEELKLREIIPEEKRGYLGINYEEVSEELHVIYQFPYGICVLKVLEGSAAEKAGIYVQDVITKVDGKEVETEEQMKQLMQSKKIGEEVVLTIARYVRGKFKEIEIPVILEKIPK